MFLRSPVEDWPVKSAKDLTVTARENIGNLQKKAFFTALSRAKAKRPEMKQEPTQCQVQAPAELRQPPIAIYCLVDVRRFRVLAQLVRTIAWIWRAAKKLIS